MRILLNISIPHDTFNAAVRDGTAGEKLQRIINHCKPEAIYFTEHDGCRGAVMVAKLESASQVPFYAEPWFLTFNADVQFRVAMTPEDLHNAGLDQLARQWS